MRLNDIVTVRTYNMRLRHTIELRKETINYLNYFGKQASKSNAAKTIRIPRYLQYIWKS